MLKLMKLIILSFVLVFSSQYVTAGGPYEDMSTVTNYDPLRKIIVLDGVEYKLIGNANGNIIINMREMGLSSLNGLSVSFLPDKQATQRKAIMDVHIPEVYGLAAEGN